MPRIRFGRSSSWGSRNEPFNSEIRVTASSPAQKALIGVVMMVVGCYIFISGEISLGRYSDFELTGAPAPFIGGALAAIGAYLAVMNAFSE